MRSGWVTRTGTQAAPQIQRTGLWPHSDSGRQSREDAQNPAQPHTGLLVLAGQWLRDHSSHMLWGFPILSPLNFPHLCGLEARMIIFGFHENRRVRVCAQILVQKCRLEPLSSSVHAFTSPNWSDDCSWGTCIFLSPKE